MNKGIQKSPTQLRNILFLTSATLFVLVSGLIFATNDSTGDKTIETQYGLIDIPQDTTILKNSIDDAKPQIMKIEDETLKIFDSEFIFSELETELLNQNQINSQTLLSFLQKVDFNNQLDLEKIQLKLQILKPEQLIKTEILVEKLNQLIYNDQMFDGSELNLNAIALELLDEYDSDDIIIDLENLLSF